MGKKNSKIAAIFIAGFICFLLLTDAYADNRPCLNPFSTVDWTFFYDKLEFKGVCACPTDNGIKIGMKWTVPEPIGFVEVVRKSYYYPCLDMKLGDTLKMSGTNYSNQGVKKNVHYIKYPVFGIMNIILDYLCVDKNTNFDIAPPSELDPRQNDDQLSLLFEPDKLLYANPIAQSICFADCASASTWKPINSLFWCAGCWGTIGTVVTNSPGADPVIESALLVTKQLDLLHADFQLWKYSDAPDLDYVAQAAQAGSVSDTTCSPKTFPRIIKSQYYMNMSYPVVSKAIPIGDFGIKWSFFKQYPGDGEDFIWTIWRVRNCCTGYQFP